MSNQFQKRYFFRNERPFLKERLEKDHKIFFYGQIVLNQSNLIVN